MNPIMCDLKAVRNEGYFGKFNDGILVTIKTFNLLCY
jgi:hypothetical protein